MQTIFSPCRKYRYTLWRVWGDLSNYCMFIGLNPSTADETNDDPTIRRCIDYAKRWGYGALCMTNIFAWRDTDPKKMKLAFDPVGPDNDRHLLNISEFASLVVAAWGKDGKHLYRGTKVKTLIPNLKCLGTNGDGTPKHPLYLKKDLVPTPLP